MAPRGAEWSSGEAVDEQVRRESVGRKEEAARGMRTLAAGAVGCGLECALLERWMARRPAWRRASERVTVRESRRGDARGATKEMECSWTEHSSDWKRWNSWDRPRRGTRPVSSERCASEVLVFTRDFFFSWR